MLICVLQGPAAGVVRRVAAREPGVAQPAAREPGGLRPCAVPGAGVPVADHPQPGRVQRALPVRSLLESCPMAWHLPGCACVGAIWYLSLGRSPTDLLRICCRSCTCVFVPLTSYKVCNAGAVSGLL